MTTVIEFMILSGGDNRPPMLDKDLYDSWQSRIELYMENREHDSCPQPQSIPQIEDTVSTVNQQTHLVEFPQIDSCLAVPMFKKEDDPIDAINKMMSFLSTVATSHFPSTNNQLRNSSNPRQQVIIHDGRVKLMCSCKRHLRRDRKRLCPWVQPEDESKHFYAKKVASDNRWLT
ncbi:hypothetical protein Tco_0378602 [Tanacetum coccineum]